MSRFHTFDDELARLDATATAEAIRNGSVSVADVVAAAIERSRRVDEAANAVATADYDRAAEAAASLGHVRPDDAAPFVGVPTFIKDMTDVEGLPTRNGSGAFANARPATRTFGIARQLFDLGMINLGKSTLPEFGFTASTEFPDGPPTRNPWNLDHSPGGSSGGAAVLVAAGAVPIAHGQDGGGSIRIPAACNGLVGLKPSRGRLLPDPHARLLPLKIVSDGVLTRTVRDTANYYLAAERHYRPAKLPPLGALDRPLNRRLRIGAFLTPPTGVAVDAPTRTAFASTIDLLGDLGHDVVEVPTPFDQQFADDFIHYWAMLAFFTRYGGKILFDRSFDPSGLSDLTRGLADRFRTNAASTLGVIRRLRRAAEIDRARFANLDVILSPVLSTLPPRLGVLGLNQPFEELFAKVAEWVAYTPIANVTGFPALSLPVTVDEPSGLPVSMMFSAALGNDETLLRLALEIEQARPFATLADATG